MGNAEVVVYVINVYKPNGKTIQAAAVHPFFLRRITIVKNAVEISVITKRTQRDSYTSQRGRTRNKRFLYQMKPIAYFHATVNRNSTVFIVE